MDSNNNNKFKIFLDIISLVLLQGHLYQCNNKIINQWIRDRIRGLISNSNNSFKNNRDLVEMVNHFKKGKTITIMVLKGITIKIRIMVTIVEITIRIIKNFKVKIIKICKNSRNNWVRKKKKKLENGLNKGKKTILLLRIFRKNSNKRKNMKNMVVQAQLSYLSLNWNSERKSWLAQVVLRN